MPQSRSYLVLFGGVALGMALFASAHSAPVTDAEKSHCLALGLRFSEIAQQEGDLLRTLRGTVNQPTLDDRQTFKELETLERETAEIGAILQDVYADAPQPTPETRAALRTVSPDALLTQVEACIPEA